MTFLKVPLLFYPPRDEQLLTRPGSHLPDNFKWRIPLSETHHITWGGLQENYLIQQVSADEGRVLASLCIHVAERSLLSIKSTAAFNAIQYTIEGDTIAHLSGYGPLALYSGTYTLQYVPEGIHEVFFEAGHYQFFYIMDEGLLALLAKEHPEIAELVTLQYKNHVSGQTGLRMHFDATVDALLRQVKNIRGNDIDAGFLLRSISSQLLQHYHWQLKNTVPESNTFLVPTKLKVFIADHMHLVVASIIAQMTACFNITPRQACRCWKQLPVRALDHPKKQAPRSFAMYMRMQLAFYLLTRPQLTVSTVADMLGYGDAYIFSRNFRRFYPFPPGAAIHHIKK